MQFKTRKWKQAIKCLLTNLVSVKTHLISIKMTNLHRIENFYSKWLKIRNYLQRIPS